MLPPRRASGRTTADMPLSSAQLTATFGDFAWHDHASLNGRVVIDGDWVARNIALVDPPFPLRTRRGARVRKIRCHFAIADQLLGVLVALRDDGLAHLVNTFDGCFVPRHMSWNPERALSRHTWGIAVDVNARTFGYGSSRKQDMRLVAAFRRFGFEAGQDWRTSDPMHFEAVQSMSLATLSYKVVVDDVVVSESARVVGGEVVAPLGMLARALGAQTVRFHPSHRKFYVYRSGR